MTDMTDWTDWTDAQRSVVEGEEAVARFSGNDPFVRGLFPENLHGLFASASLVEVWSYGFATIKEIGVYGTDDCMQLMILANDSSFTVFYYGEGREVVREESYSINGRRDSELIFSEGQRPAMRMTMFLRPGEEAKEKWCSECGCGIEVDVPGVCWMSADNCALENVTYLCQDEDGSGTAEKVKPTIVKEKCSSCRRR